MALKKPTNLEELLQFEVDRKNIQNEKIKRQEEEKKSRATIAKEKYSDIRKNIIEPTMASDIKNKLEKYGYKLIHHKEEDTDSIIKYTVETPERELISMQRSTTYGQVDKPKFVKYSVFVGFGFNPEKSTLLFHVNFSHSIGGIQDLNSEMLFDDFEKGMIEEKIFLALSLLIQPEKNV
jgi:hypothetical protein